MSEDDEQVAEASTGGAVRVSEVEPAPLGPAPAVASEAVVIAPEVLAGSLSEYLRAWAKRIRGGESGALPILVGLIVTSHPQMGIFDSHPMRRWTISISEEALENLESLAAKRGTTVLGVVEGAAKLIKKGGRNAEAMAKSVSPDRRGRNSHRLARSRLAEASGTS